MGLFLARRQSPGDGEDGDVRRSSDPQEAPSDGGRALTRNLTLLNKNGPKKLQKTQSFVPIALLSTPLPIATPCEQQRYDLGGKSKRGRLRNTKKPLFMTEDP